MLVSFLSFGLQLSFVAFHMKRENQKVFLLKAFIVQFSCMKCSSGKIIKTKRKIMKTKVEIIIKIHLLFFLSCCEVKENYKRNLEMMRRQKKEKTFCVWPGRKNFSMYFIKNKKIK